MAPDEICAQATNSLIDHKPKVVCVVGEATGPATLPAVARHVHVVRARVGGVSVGRRRVGIRRRIVVGIHIGAGVGAVRAGVGDGAVVVVIVSVAAAGAAERQDDEGDVDGVEKERRSVTVCLTVGHQSFLCSAPFRGGCQSLPKAVVYTILAVLSIARLTLFLSPYLFSSRMRAKKTCFFRRVSAENMWCSLIWRNPYCCLS